jgi:ring-1,2-phenylacetyl-CoA epoxidase subunit PaaC
MAVTTGAGVAGVPGDLDLRYILRMADTCLIHSQRLGEWCGHAPVLEEDIALTNMALDLLGQARALLGHAGTLYVPARDEDQLAFLRDEAEYLNLTLVELPMRKGGADFADTVLRNFMLSTWLEALWQRLADSRDTELAAIAGKAVKEARYHREHAADWVVRLGDGTAESARRLHAAHGQLWPYSAEMFDADDVDHAAAATTLGPPRDALAEPWQTQVQPVFDAAGLGMPPYTAFRTHGSRGRHSEHMGFLLAEMQHLQRAYPGGTW